MTSDLRLCLLCGRAFAILIAETAGEAESDKLCSDCQRLSSPPAGRDTAEVTH